MVVLDPDPHPLRKPDMTGSQYPIVQGHACPRCGGPIVHSGNYFCAAGGCWAMDAAETTSPADQQIIDDYVRQRAATTPPSGDRQ